jgi:hypothetical protein
LFLNFLKPWKTPFYRQRQPGFRLVRESTATTV